MPMDEVKKYVKDMDICYTDTWLDMEFFNDPAYQDKKKELMDKMMPYQLNDEFLEGSHALVFHDMPMHVGFEISKDVEMKNLDHILDQAENRRHAEKAVMYTLIKEFKWYNIWMCGFRYWRLCFSLALVRARLSASLP